MKTLRLAPLALALLSFTSAFADMSSGLWPAAPAPQGVVAPAGMHYVWGDEFDGPDGSAPDPRKWGYEHGFVRNKEPQFYTVDRRENARIEKGALVITGRLEKFSEGGKSAKYTSASVISQGKFAFKYGRIEIRAKLPEGTGNWPALWMMGEDRGKAVGWPACGEIDIMEHLGREPGTVYATLHTPGDGGKGHASQGSFLKKQTTTAAFHVYGMDWTPDKVTLTFDGKTVFEHTKTGPNPKHLQWVFDKPYYVLMNLAFGGNWAGTKGIDEKAFPARFEIDYVRVFQKD